MGIIIDMSEQLSDCAVQVKELMVGLQEYVQEMIVAAQSHGHEEVVIGLAVAVLFAILLTIYFKVNDTHYGDVVDSVEDLADQFVQRICDIKTQIEGWIGNDDNDDGAQPKKKPSGQSKQEPTGQPKKKPTGQAKKKRAGRARKEN